MFKIVKEKFGAFTQIHLENPASGESVSFIPDYSASINALVLRKGIHLHPIVYGCSDYEVLTDLGKRKFMGSKLFPFPNRIKDGIYSFNHEQYQLPINYPEEGHAIHGLVLEKCFEVVNEIATEEEALVSVQYDYNGSISGYPFPYSLTIDFILNVEGFTCTSSVKNTSQNTIPVADGWHPYFTLHGLLNNFLLTIPSAELVEIDERMIPTGTLLTNAKYRKGAKIGEEAFDTCFAVAPQEGIAELELTNTISDITLVMWQETGKNKYNYIQIYTPPSRDFIAIEPMTCQPDAFNNGQGLILLEPEASVDFSFGIKLR
jgi:aldose 1-epimerase